MSVKKILSNPDDYEFGVQNLGECKLESPIRVRDFVENHESCILTNDLCSIQRYIKEGKKIPAFEKAGPRHKIFHNPAWSKAAIVTCGGLCPGLNDVIKGIVQILWYGYGVENIIGIPYGFRGFIPKFKLSPIPLDPDVVDQIHEQGGTILGSSRGQQDTSEIVDTLQREGINLLFCVGGDGTLRAAREISEMCHKRHAPVSVVGIPKTIDNDLNFVGRCFGFETAVYRTNEIITSAHMEAKGVYNGIGLVKLMGRDSGFIAAYASIANSVVNFCMIPEVPFTMDGPNGLLAGLERRFGSVKTHAVIVVAEGAGQELIKGEPERRDESNNIIKKDIGEFLKRKIKNHFDSIGISVTLKYFDPSYSIRSVAAQGTDAILCYQLAKCAVHAAMAGRTNCVIGNLNGTFSHVPIALATADRRKIEPRGDLWRTVLDVTRQLEYMGHETSEKG